MTKGEEYINKDLTQNYEVITMSHSFAVLDKQVGKKFYIVDFTSHMADIYTKASDNIVGEWFKINSAILAKDLNDKIASLDYSSKTSDELYKDLVEYFNKPNIKGKFDISFIRAHFFDYHKKTNINPVLDDISSKLTKDEDIDVIVERFKLTEPREITNYISEYLISNYMLRFVNDKLVDFLRQLVMTPGARGWDWKVTWIGHGEVNRDKVRLHFETESESIIKLIMVKYKEWFDNEAYEASVRLTERNMNINLVD
jgi:hypothetical protein